MLPLAVPGIATISLFAALGYWNDWFNALLYIQKDTLVPLQYLLMKIQNNLEFLSRSTDMGAAAQEGLGVLQVNRLEWRLLSYLRYQLR